MSAPEESVPRVAVVSGASRGLGRAIALHLLDAGWSVAAFALHRPELARGEGPALLTRAADVADAGAVESVLADAVSAFGPVGLWVNNAGLLDPIGRLADVDPVAVARLVEVNVTGVLFGSACFARHVRSRPGGGVLVNVSSGAATHPYVGWVPYCASKAAVDQVTAVVALEEAGEGLVAVSLSPGLVDTDMQALIRTQDAADFPEVDRFKEAAEHGALNPPEWVASFVEELASGTFDGRPVTSGSVQRVPGHRGS